MNWSHIGKVVTAVLLGAAAVVGIVAWLTTLVGLVIAVVGIVLLIIGATVVAVVTRPDKKPAKSISPSEPSPGPISQQPKDKEPESKVQSPKPKPKSEKDEGPKVTALPVQKEEPRLEPVTKASVTGVRLGEVYRRAASQPPPKPSPMPATKPPQPSFKEEQLVRKRSEVAAGAVTTLKLAVVKEDFVYGRLREVDGYEFTWAIVDLKNLGLMERKMRFIAQQGEWDVPTATVEWTVPSDGPWFLAFDASGKQYVREVAVELWRRIPE